MVYNYPCILIDYSDPNNLKPVWFQDKQKLTGERVIWEENDIQWKDDSMNKSSLPKGTLWVTTHRYVFQTANNKSSESGLFEIPFEIFVKESYIGGFFQSGHRVKIKRDGAKDPKVYDSNWLDIMIQNIANAKAEEIKADPNIVIEEYRRKVASRVFPNKITLFWPSKTVRNKLKTHIDSAVAGAEWTKVKFDINKYIRKNDIGIGNIMGRQKEKDSIISSKIALTTTDINQLSSTAHELIDIANEIKKKLSKYKEQFSNYHENAEIMEMIFNLGINNDDDDVFVQESKQSMGSKEFKKRVIKDLVEFLDDHIKEYGGWIPCAELYCKFNRSLGTELVSPEEFMNACIALEKTKNSDGTFYIFNRSYQVKNNDTIAVITHDKYSIRKKASTLSKKLQKKNGVGLTQTDIVKVMKMNYVIIDQVIEKALSDGKIVVDEQDPVGKKILCQ